MSNRTDAHDPSTREDAGTSPSRIPQRGGTSEAQAGCAAARCCEGKGGKNSAMATAPRPMPNEAM
jgi:hypothetical protein